jgi:glutathione S-transferase
MYDTEHKLMPADPVQRVKVRTWIHAAEATFALHALAILYARWHIKDAPDALAAAEQAMAANVVNDFSWLETELSLSQGRFLCADHVTAADCMMQFSVRFALERELGTGEREWPGIRRWLDACEGTEGYRRAVERTGHRL